MTFALASALSCGSPPAPTPPAPAPSASAASSAIATPVPVADTGPALSQRTGATTARKLSPVRVAATRSLAKHGHYYVSAPFDVRDAALEDLPSLANIGTRVVAAHVVGDRHAMAALAWSPPESAGAQRAELRVRFVGEQPPSEPVVVRLAASGSESDGKRAAAGVSVELGIDGLRRAPRSAALQDEFFAAAAWWFAQRSWDSRGAEPFFAFAGARLDQLAGKSAGAAATRWNGPRFASEGELGTLMDLYTGMTSIEEALQTDRGLATVRRSSAARTRDPSGVAGVPLPAHPWQRMLSELPKGTQPVVEPLAASVPADMAYLHFHDIRSMLGLFTELDGWISPLAQTLEHAAGFKSFGDRYDEELGVQRSGLAEKLGNLAVSGVALCASDPYLREGSDVSLVFAVKSRSLLVGALDAMAAVARNAHPGTKSSRLNVNGRTVDVLESPDGSLRQHRLDLGDVIVVSNSPNAIARFTEVAAKKRKSLSESGDFRYLRARYPFDPKQEDGFLFVSDAFIANVVGPRAKILEARRLMAGADISAVANAALLFGWLEGRKPKSADELTKSKLLRKDELTHPEGDAVRFDAERGPSSRWGRPARLASLIDLDLGKVSAAEVEAYARFREGYQHYWRTYVDPIAVRIRRSPDGKKLSADVRILPLIEQSDYDDMIRDVGEQTVSVPALGSGLRWVLAIGRDAEVRKLGDGFAHQFTRRRDIALGWMGDWVAAGASDRSGLWDLALGLGEVPELTGRARSGDDEMQVIARSPLFVAVHVKSRVGLAAALAATRAFLDDTAPGLLTWDKGAPHRSVETTRVGAKEQPRSPEVVIHYAVAKDVLIVSLDRYTLEQQIDAVLDGRMPTSERPGDTQTALELRPDRTDGFLAKTLAGLLHGEAAAAHRGAQLSFEALARGLGSLPANADDRRRTALDWLGIEPASPHGGEFTLDADGVVVHSLLGSEVAPVAPPILGGSSALDRVVGDLAFARFTVAFDGKGTHRGLHATMQWDRR